MILRLSDGVSHVGMIRNELFDISINIKQFYTVSLPTINESGNREDIQDRMNVYSIVFQHLHNKKFKVQADIACNDLFLKPKEVLTVFEWIAFSNEYFNWNKFDRKKLNSTVKLAFVTEMEDAFNRASNEYNEE